MTVEPPTNPAVAEETVSCSVIDGEDVNLLLDVLSQANARTPWIVDGRTVSLAFRPVVPGQPGCPSR